MIQKVKKWFKSALELFYFNTFLPYLGNAGFILYGKGGGSTKSTGTTYTTNIPDYAKPYVMSMLGATQKQMFNTDASGNITGFKPYTPYSTNMQDYVAGFSPLQQNAQQMAGNMQMPGQFGAASQLAGAGGLGSLGLANQAAGAGERWRQSATNPYDVQQYMNPYLQASLNPQIAAMRRQYGITGQQQQSNATQQGAFGGSREALMASENQRSMNSAIDNAIAQGYNQAFQNAQGLQQFGANLDLQGLQQALSGMGQAGQAAATLGQLGGAQQTAEQNIMNAQNTMGTQQQALQQQMINQAIQDYATAQQYPMMQLGMMSNMLRGLPMQGVTTQSYQAAPSALTQGIGAMGTGYALQQALGGNKAAGGVIKSYAKGGIASYDVGGEVEHDLRDYPVDKLKEIADSSSSQTVRERARAILKEKTSYAPGGIVAFAQPTKENNQSLVKEDDDVTPQDIAYGNALDQSFLGWIPRAGKAIAADVAELPSKLNWMIDPKTNKLVHKYEVEGVTPRMSNFEQNEKLRQEKGIAQYDQAMNREKAAGPAAAKGNAQIIDRALGNPLMGRPNLYQSLNSSVPTLPAEQDMLDSPRNPLANLKDKETPTKDNRGRNIPEATPDQSAAYTPTTDTVKQGILDMLPKEVQDRLKKAPTEQSMEQIMADRENYLGKDTASQDYRKKIMDERANAADEAKRQDYMRMAEFFATWGSTPGPVLVAGMQAAQKTIPNIISDKKEQKKANRELDKIIFDLDHAARLEKAGNWDKAQEIKVQQAKNMHEWMKNNVDVGTTAATIAGQDRRQAMSDAAAKDRAIIQGEYGVKEAGIRSATSKEDKDLALAQKADAEYNDIRKDNETIKNNPKGPYQLAQEDIKNFAKSAKENPKGIGASQYKSAVETKERMDKEFAAREKEAKDIRDAYWKRTGFEGPKNTGNPNIDLNQFFTK